MKPSKMSLGPSARKIVAGIEKVREAANKAAKSKRRFADYRYLRSVLSAYIFLENNDLLPSMVEIAPSVLLTPVRSRHHPLRIIIDATCKTPDLRTRSRWTRALFYSLAERIDPQDLTRFIRANGGIAGCADLASKTSRARNKRSRMVDVPIFRPAKPELQNPWKLF